MKKYTPLEVHKTIGILAAAFLLAHYLFSAVWLVPTALVLLVLLVIGGPIPRAITALWMGFAHVLGRINTAIILTLVYLVVLTPLAVLFRLFNKEAGAYFFKPTLSTMLVQYTETIDPSFFDRQW